MLKQIQTKTNHLFLTRLPNTIKAKKLKSNNKAISSESRPNTSDFQSVPLQHKIFNIKKQLKKLHSKYINLSSLVKKYILKLNLLQINISNFEQLIYVNNISYSATSSIQEIDYTT